MAFGYSQILQNGPTLSLSAETWDGLQMITLLIRGIDWVQAFSILIGRQSERKKQSLTLPFNLLHSSEILI